MQWYYWLIVVICSLFSMFFSSADMVYSVVDRKKLEEESNKGIKSASRALKIANDYETSIASILFGNNLVNIAASSIVTIIGTYWNSNWGSTVATILFTIFIIIFSEFLPKSLSKKYAFALSKAYSIPVTVLKYITLVIVWPLGKLFKAIGKLFKHKSEEEAEISEDELTSMVDEIEESGEYDEQDAEIVRSAIDINGVEAHEIMTPRVDVFMINVEDDINEIIKEGEIFKHSRIPVYKDTVDNIIGILPIKNLARARFNHENNIDVLSMCYKPLIIPRNREVLDLLNQFKESKIHIALVIDEYGGVEGIITMEDILEEIVGEIFDETDEIEEEYIDSGDGTYIIDGSMNIEDFFELIDFHEEFETDYETVSGLCQEILDRFAVADDEFMFMDRYRFIILAADEYTVEKLKVIDTQYEKKDEE